MDDESEADLYGDLLPFDRRNDEDFKKVEAANANLRQEIELLKQQNEKLLQENRSLTQDKKKLETNFSSLIKTAQTEMKRKEQTIAELRREKDSVVFRRGRNSRYDNRPPERNYNEPRREIQLPEPIEQLHEPVVAPKPFSHLVIAAPIIQEVIPIVIPDVPAEEIAALKVQDAVIIPDIPTIVPKSNACPQTIFSKRHLHGVNTPVEITAEKVKRVEEIQTKTLVPSEVRTPESNPESKKKKRITPVMISEPTPKVVDQNKNKIVTMISSLDQSIPKVANESRSQNTTVCAIPTPKAAKIQTNHEVSVNSPITIPKSKIFTHVKASFDTLNSKTCDFKRRVSTNMKDVKPKPESVSKSPLKRNPSFMSENSSDGLRRPSNYDLMKRNVKHKYHSLDSPNKSDRSRRSRSRSVWRSEKRDRSKRSHRERSVNKSESRKKDGLGREGESSKRHSPSRRLSRVDRSPALEAASKRDSSPAKRESERSSSKRQVQTYSLLQNFSPVRSSTTKKDSEKKSSRDRSLLDSQSPSTSKSKVRLDYVLEKLVGTVPLVDKQIQKEVLTALESSRSKAAEPTTEKIKPTDTLKKVSSTVSIASTSNVHITSPSKQTEAKRKSIESVADSLTMKLTSSQTTEMTTKTVETFALATALKVTNATTKEPETQRTTMESPPITDVISALTRSIMPIPPKDFLSARILADYKTPTASAENSTEVSQAKTMSPPDAPRPRYSHAPTSFSGIKLGGDKQFSYPFTPMKIDIANEYIGFPSMITPLKATPVKVDYVEEDSLDVMMRLQLARNKDQLGDDMALLVEHTVTRVESEMEWKLQALESSDIAGGKEKDETKNADEVGDTEPDKSVNASGETISETLEKSYEKRTTDVEEGEVTDKSNPKPAPKEPEKPMVTFFKKTKEPKAKRTQLADAKKVVSPSMMFDLRQKMLARTESVAPPRKDIRDYEIRLKSPYKTNPRVSSANRVLGTMAPCERLTFNDYPPKSSRSRSPENGRLSRSRSPTAMFLEKSPERLELRKSGPGCTSQEKRSEHRSKSPRQETASYRTRLASSSRSRSPRDLLIKKSDPHRTRPRQKSPTRLSMSVSHSRSSSPRPRSTKRPQQLQPVSQSRSRSPLTSTVCKSSTKQDDRSNRFQVSSTKRSKQRSRSRSKSPSRELRNGSSKINDRLQLLASNRSGGEVPFRRRRTAFITDWSASRSNRRSPSKSRSRSVSPIKAVPQRGEGRHIRSQESPRKTGRGRNWSDSPSPERLGKTRRGEGRHGCSQESPRKAGRGRNRSGSPSPERPGKPRRGEGRLSRSQESPRKGRRSRNQSDSLSPERPGKELPKGSEKSHIQSQESPRTGGKDKNWSKSPSPERPGNREGNDSSARPFKRRRSTFKTATNGPGQKVNEQIKLIDRILDSDSGISEKNISPVGKATLNQEKNISPVGKATHNTCLIPTMSNNLPDILSTLDSNLSPATLQSAELTPGKTKSLEERVNSLVQTTNPEVQQCLKSVHAIFTPAAENKATLQTTPASSNGFVARKRHKVRMLPQGTPCVTTKQSPPKLSEPVSAVGQPSEATPIQSGKPATLNQAALVPTENKSTATTFNPASSIASNAEASTNGLPFGRRRRKVKMLPPSNLSTPNPTPTKELAAVAVESSPCSDLGRKANDVTLTMPWTEFPILGRALGWSPSNSIGDRSVDSTRQSSKDRSQSLDVSSGCEKSKREAKRKRDSRGSEEGPWKKRRTRIVSTKTGKTSDELLKKAKSLFGSDTEEEEDFTVKRSEYVKMGSESSDDPYVSEGVESEESGDEWTPARSHTRKEPAPETTSPPSIWPTRPEEPKRRTTVFLEDLPKSSEKIIEELMHRASKSISAKKKKRHSHKPKATLKAPKSAEFVQTDDSDY